MITLPYKKPDAVDRPVSAPVGRNGMGSTAQMATTASGYFTQQPSLSPGTPTLNPALAPSSTPGRTHSYAPQPAHLASMMSPTHQSPVALSPFITQQGGQSWLEIYM